MLAHQLNQFDPEGSIRKADAVCFSAHATDASHTAVQRFIHLNGKISRGPVARWLTDPAVEDID
jgi:hypothetical protein